MMKSLLSKGTAITGLACLATVGLVAMYLQHCASEPTPHCAVPPGSVIASYVAMGPPSPAPGAATNTNCSTWVPPFLQAGGCGQAGCEAVTNVGGEVFILETGYPDPNNTSWVHQPYSMAIQNSYIHSRIQDYINNVNQWADAGLLGPAPYLPNYPYTSSNPPPQLAPGDQTSTNRPYNWAPFDSIYPNNQICTVNLPESKMVYPDIPAHPVSTSAMCNTDMDCMEGGTAPCLGATPDAGIMGQCSDTPDQPQTTIDYKWSNVKVVADIAGGNIGGQIFADLTITQDSCTQSFHVSIMSPQSSCNGMAADGGTIADPTQCLPNPTNSDNYPTIGDASTMGAIYGSGIYPNVPVKCLPFYPPGPEGGPSPTTDFECQPTRTQPTF